MRILRRNKSILTKRKNPYLNIANVLLVCTYKQYSVCSARFGGISPPTAVKRSETNISRVPALRLIFNVKSGQIIEPMGYTFGRYRASRTRLPSHPSIREEPFPGHARSKTDVESPLR
jgi:hypothetical protein